jgi:23S rRNA (adenine1618-N6)-methyltransferase
MAICGVDIDAKALRNAQQIIEANGLQQQISLRQQANPVNIFKGVNTARGAIYIDHMQPAFSCISGCGPGTDKTQMERFGQPAQALNFGGQANKLVYGGGEAAFLTAMINESKHFGAVCLVYYAGV